MSILRTLTMITAAAAITLAAAPQPVEADNINTTIDFTVAQVTPPAAAVSGSVSTYGENGNIITSQKHREALKRLGLGLYRLPLQWNNGSIISSAGGGPREYSGDQWYDAIASVGAKPMVVVGGSKDNNFTPQDAANLVRHFSGQREVTYWVVGNEPANGADRLSIQDYCSLFNASADAMKAVNPNIKLVGPAWAWFEIDRLKDFIDCAGAKVDVIDFHNYGSGGDYRPTTEKMMADTQQWGDQINQLRAYVREKFPARAAAMQYQVGETNFGWSAGDTRIFGPDATVWMASITGHILRAGGRVLQYSDLNGELGLTFEKTANANTYGRSLFDPMPVYYGLQAFTGGSLYGESGKVMVKAETTLPNVETYAFDNAKRIIIINKSLSDAQTINFKLTGYNGGKGSVWQTDRARPFDAPAAKGALTVTGGQATVAAPPLSVTVITLGDGGGTGTVTPAPTKGDLNGDGRVTVLDLSRLLSDWGKGGTASDLNRDGKVGVIDLSILLSNWTAS